jgi:hypothetical protein
MGDARGDEAELDRAQLGLVGGGERDGAGAVREVAGAALARGVDQLGGEDPAREVLADDAVVMEISGKVEKS